MEFALAFAFPFSIPIVNGLLCEFTFVSDFPEAFIPVPSDEFTFAFSDASTLANSNGSGLNMGLNGSYGIGLNNGNVSVNESTTLNNGKALLNETIHVVAGNLVRIGDLFINGNAITSGNVSINGSVVSIGNIVSINNGEIEVDGRGTGVRISGQGAQEAANIGADVIAFPFMNKSPILTTLPATTRIVSLSNAFPLLMIVLSFA